MKKVKKKMAPTNNSGANTPKTGIFQHVWHFIELFTESKSDFAGLLDMQLANLSQKESFS